MFVFAGVTQLLALQYRFGKKRADGWRAADSHAGVATESGQLRPGGNDAGHLYGRRHGRANIRHAAHGNDCGRAITVPAAGRHAFVRYSAIADVSFAFSSHHTYD